MGSCLRHRTSVGDLPASIVSALDPPNYVIFRPPTPPLGSLYTLKLHKKFAARAGTRVFFFKCKGQGAWERSKKMTTKSTRSAAKFSLQSAPPPSAPGCSWYARRRGPRRVPLLEQ